MIYELKTYIAHPGKATALRERFLQKTLPLFAKNGITIVTVMSPADTPDELCYVTRFDSEQAKIEAWARFMADPEWKAVKAASETDGPLLASQTTAVFNALTP